MDLIDWTCDTCHANTGGRGAIHISYADLRDAQLTLKSWSDRPNSADYMHWDATDALTQPQLVLWKVECNTCAGTCGDSYWIDLEQARTVSQLAEWTKHLSPKTWFPATNWTALVASVGVTRPLRSAV